MRVKIMSNASRFNKNKLINQVAQNRIKAHIINSMPYNLDGGLDELDSDLLAISSAIDLMSETDKMVVTIYSDDSGFCISARYDYRTPFYGHSKLDLVFIYASFEAAFDLLLNTILSIKKHNIKIKLWYPKGVTNEKLSSNTFKGKMFFILKK